MNQGRLSIELRERTKRFASATIRLFVDLPKQREEVGVLGQQLLRSGTSVAAHVREASRAAPGPMMSLFPNWEEPPRRLTNRNFGSNCSGTIAPFAVPRWTRYWPSAGEVIAIFVTMINRTKGKS